MSPIDRAFDVADAYPGAEIVATPDRVTADLRIIRGGWDIIAAGVVVAHVDLDGETCEFVTRRAS